MSESTPTLRDWPGPRHAAATATRRDAAARQTERLLSSASDDHSASAVVRERVVLLNLSLADGIASRYVGRGIERDDLLQVARVALVKAVRRYRPGVGASFTAYAAPTITGEIKRHFRDSGWMVRPPRRLQELCAELNAAQSGLEQGLHRSPSTAELALAMGVDEAQVARAREAASGFRAVSLDGLLVADSRPEVQTVDNPCAEYDNAQWLAWGVEELDAQDRAILRWRFVELLTQAEIAQQLGVSQTQVSRLLRAILDRLRERLESSLAAA